MSAGAARDAVPLDHRLDGRPGGRVVALANSLGTSPGLWDGQLAALAERFRVLRYDHRGHGRSPVPAGPYSIADLGHDLLALLDRLEVDRVSLCGVSMGGMVAMWLASQAPERVDRLVLCCTSAHLEPRSAWVERAATVRARGTAAVADAVLERWFTPSFRAERPEAVARARQMLEATPAEGYAACCEAIAELDLRGRLRAVLAPTLVIAGADDPATPPEQARLLAEGIPSARLVVLPDAAHLANVEQAGAVTGAVLDHLGEGEEREG